jgi:hypothetical protein
MSDETHESAALLDNCAGIEYPRGFQATMATEQETRRLGIVHLGHQDGGCFVDNNLQTADSNVNSEPALVLWCTLSQNKKQIQMQLQLPCTSIN